MWPAAAAVDSNAGIGLFLGAENASLDLDQPQRFLSALRRALHSTDRAPMAVPQAVPQDDVEQLRRLATAVGSLREQVALRIVGQQDSVDGILTAILGGGHALLIGVPGLAKTLMVQTLAEALDLSFNRVQFTPDLMPGDITGTEIVEEDP